MIVEAFLFLHILGGSLALVAGHAALFARKGGRLHQKAGMLFVYAMLAMGAGAAVFGLARDEPGWLGGPLAVYLVITATRTVRRGVRPQLPLDGGLLLVALALGAVFLVGGLQGVTGSGRVSGGPAVASLVNAVLLFAAAAGDARVLRFGPLTGHRRLARHLWRMCFAFFSATGSFFLGQADVIPEPLRFMPALAALAFLPLGFLFYWLWRVRRPPYRFFATVRAVHRHDVRPQQA